VSCSKASVRSNAAPAIQLLCLGEMIALLPKKIRIQWSSLASYELTELLRIKP